MTFTGWMRLVPQCAWRKTSHIDGAILQSYSLNSNTSTIYLSEDSNNFVFKMNGWAYGELQSQIYKIPKSAKSLDPVLSLKQLLLLRTKLFKHSSDIDVVKNFKRALDTHIKLKDIKKSMFDIVKQLNDKPEFKFGDCVFKIDGNSLLCEWGGNVVKHNVPSYMLPDIKLPKVGNLKVNDFYL